MSYEVRCECGKARPVTAADAGASLRCGCGRSVEVPPLHQLRATAGQAGVSAEMQLYAMLHKGELPGTDECIRCHRTTGGVVRVVIECERAENKFTHIGEAQAIAQSLLDNLLKLVVGFSWTNPQPVEREDRVLGRHVVFTVPLRVCGVCDTEIRSAGALRETLRRVPVYAALLDKYPWARITHYR